jgi:hypothetical protein
MLRRVKIGQISKFVPNRQFSMSRIEFAHMQNYNNRNKAVIVKPGYCKAKIFKALYNQAEPTGMGVLNHVKGNFNVEQAWKCLDENGDYLDYANGRGMKLDFRDLDKERVLYSRRYDDRQQGSGTMVKRLNHMYQTEPNCYNCQLEVCKKKSIQQKAVGEKTNDDL